MKVPNKLVRWSQEPWTVVRTFMYDHDDIVYWYAFNTRTGERRPKRPSYDKAFADIPESKYAEPWGV